MYDFKIKRKNEIKNGAGKVKDYNEKGNLIFEGEYLNGKRWNGKGKEFDDYRLIYDGEYLNGKRNGKGKEYYSIKEIYDLKGKKRY